MVLLIIGCLLVISLTVWSVFDINRKRFMNKSMKPIWLVIVVILPLLGPIFYIQNRKNLINSSPSFNPAFMSQNSE